MGPSTRGQESGSEAALTYRLPQCHKQPYRNYAVIWGTRAIRSFMGAMFEPHQEIAQLEKNLVEINLLVSRQLARIERLAEKGAIQQKPRPCFGGWSRSSTTSTLGGSASSTSSHDSEDFSKRRFCAIAPTRVSSPATRRIVLLSGLIRCRLTR
jgi:hypothetical protein